MEISMSFAGSEKPITGLILLVYPRKPGGYGFNEFEMSNSTISTVFRQPLKKARRVVTARRRPQSSSRMMSNLQRNFGRLYAAQQRYQEALQAFAPRLALLY